MTKPYKSPWTWGNIQSKRKYIFFRRRFFRRLLQKSPSEHVKTETKNIKRKKKELSYCRYHFTRCARTETKIINETGTKLFSIPSYLMCPIINEKWKQDMGENQRRAQLIWAVRTYAHMPTSQSSATQPHHRSRDTRRLLDSERTMRFSSRWSRVQRSRPWIKLFIFLGANFQPHSRKRHAELSSYGLRDTYLTSGTTSGTCLTLCTTSDTYLTVP